MCNCQIMLKLHLWCNFNIIWQLHIYSWLLERERDWERERQRVRERDRQRGRQIEREREMYSQAVLYQVWHQCASYKKPRLQIDRLWCFVLLQNVHNWCTSSSCCRLGLWHPQNGGSSLLSVSGDIEYKINKISKKEWETIVAHSLRFYYCTMTLMSHITCFNPITQTQPMFPKNRRTPRPSEFQLFFSRDMWPWGYFMTQQK